MFTLENIETKLVEENRKGIVCMVINGQIVAVLTQKENDWGRYKVDCTGKEYLAVGIIPSAAVGMVVTLDGEEVTDKYGRQYKISSVLNTEADANAGVRRFFADGYVKGFGPSTGDKLVNAFGKDVLDMFETEDGIARLTTVKGVTRNKIEKALPSIRENEKYKEIVLFLNGMGTKLQVEEIYKKYGEDTVKILRKNPYRLQMDVDGFGFKKTDALAIASGIKPDSIYRVMAGIKYVIEEASTAKGHCYLTVSEIKEQLVPLLVPMPKFEDITAKVADNAAADWDNNKEKLIKNYDPSAETLLKLSQTVESRKLIENTLADALSQAIEEGDFVNDDGRIYVKKMYECELNAAEMIAKMVNSNPVRFIKPENIEASIKRVEARKTAELKKNGIEAVFTATQEQREAVYLGVMHRLAIISGGPGRGKTAISEIVAEAFLSSGLHYNKEDIIMLAPTGRAAQRISESTGYASMTAQRAVMSMKVRHEAPPKNKLILMDESSMADIWLLKDVLEFAQDCNLIFVGDVDQIASVGPGKVLKDMIDCGSVPCILLKQGHRNSGTIAHNSELINQGMTIDKYCYDEHFIYIPSSLETISETIVADYVKKVEQYGIQNVMLCAAMKERGEVSVNKLNTRLQAHYTVGREEAVIGGRTFRVGDRVMQTKNDYQFVSVRKNEKTGKSEMIEGIFNGERGTIAKIVYDEHDETYKITVAFDDGKYGGYTNATIPNLVLAYATTLHKCQGSEAACMMMTYTFGDYMLLNRSLFYTGETRAKKEFRFYGEEQFKYGQMLSAFDVAVGKTDDLKRNTALGERINRTLGVEC